MCTFTCIYSTNYSMLLCMCEIIYILYILGKGSMDSQNQQQSQASPLTKPGLQSPTFPLLSNMPYSPPTSPLGSQVREFIEPCVQFDPALDLGGRTALHLAIAHQHPQVVAILLSYSGIVQAAQGVMVLLYFRVHTCTYI